MSVLQCKTTLFFQTPCGVHPYWQLLTVILSRRAIFHVLKVADGPG